MFYNIQNEAKEIENTKWYYIMFKKRNCMYIHIVEIFTLFKPYVGTRESKLNIMWWKYKQYLEQPIYFYDLLYFSYSSNTPYVSNLAHIGRLILEVWTIERSILKMTGNWNLIFYFIILYTNSLYNKGIEEYNKFLIL